MINKAYINARKGFVPPEVFDYLEDHAFNYYCEKGGIYEEVYVEYEKEFLMPPFGECSNYLEKDYRSLKPNILDNIISIFIKF